MPQRQKEDITNEVGKPQSEYAESVNRAGNYWLRRHSGINKPENPDYATADDDEYMRKATENTRRMQFKDQTEGMRVNAAGGGNIPQYKHGGIVPRTGPALLHKGEEVIPKEARDILGGAGAKLHAHEVHIRHTAEKGKYIAKHILKDKDGNPPTDGQRGEAEYSLGSPEEMMDHLHQHMVAPDQDDEESPAAEQG